MLFLLSRALHHVNKFILRASFLCVCIWPWPADCYLRGAEIKPRGWGDPNGEMIASRVRTGCKLNAAYIYNHRQQMRFWIATPPRSAHSSATLCGRKRFKIHKGGACPRVSRAKLASKAHKMDPKIHLFMDGDVFAFRSGTRVLGSNILTRRKGNDERERPLIKQFVSLRTRRSPTADSNFIN